MAKASIELPDDIEALKQIVLEQRTKIEENDALLLEQDATFEEYTRHIEILEEFVRLLKHKQFGSRSEKGSTSQLGLFDEAEMDAAEFVEEPVEDEEEAIEIPTHQRKKADRKPLPAWFPRVEILHDLPEHEKICPYDGEPLVEIGREFSEQLEFIPATIGVLRHIRPKYACPSCKTGVKIAPLPPQPIPKSMASPVLLAHVATCKYVDGLPLYRIEKVLQRGEIQLPRSTLASWMVKTGELVQPLINLVREEMLAGEIVVCDETRVQVLKEVGKPATSQSYMWVQRGGEEKTPLLLYDYDPSRSGEVPKKLLEGFTGYLQTDGYEGYNAVVSANGLTHVGCWAHARRKFDEALKAQKKSKKKAKRSSKESKALQGLRFIQRLYRVERKIADEPPEERHRIRQEYSKPILVEIREWLNASVGAVPPQSLTGKALGYLDKQWPKLVSYLEDGRLRIDTNLVENAIRPFVVGRKGWLFSDTVRGAEASANLYSLIETAKANGLEPYAYLRRVFEELPKAETLAEIELLLPHRIKLGPSPEVKS
jgi:transposase